MNPLSLLTKNLTRKREELERLRDRIEIYRQISKFSHEEIKANYGIKVHESGVVGNATEELMAWHRNLHQFLTSLNTGKIPSSLRDEIQFVASLEIGNKPDFEFLRSEANRFLQIIARLESKSDVASLERSLVFVQVELIAISSEIRASQDFRFIYLPGEVLKLTKKPARALKTLFSRYYQEHTYFTSEELLKETLKLRAVEGRKVSHLFVGKDAKRAFSILVDGDDKRGIYRFALRPKYSPKRSDAA